MRERAQRPGRNSVHSGERSNPGLGSAEIGWCPISKLRTRKYESVRELSLVLGRPGSSGSWQQVKPVGIAKFGNHLHAQHDV